MPNDSAMIRKDNAVPHDCNLNCKLPQLTPSSERIAKAKTPKPKTKPHVDEEAINLLAFSISGTYNSCFANLSILEPPLRKLACESDYKRGYRSLLNFYIRTTMIIARIKGVDFSKEHAF